MSEFTKEQLKLVENKIEIDNSPSPYIFYNHKKVGLYDFMTKTIHLDYTFKLLGIVTDTEIECFNRNNIPTILAPILIHMPDYSKRPF